MMRRADEKKFVSQKSLFYQQKVLIGPEFQ
jgi:hypothetical protein